MRKYISAVLTVNPNLLSLFIWCAVLAALLNSAAGASRRVNTDPAKWDQSAVIELAMKIREQKAPFLTDGNRHPLFPLLSAAFVDLTPEGFARAKKFSFAVCAASWLALFLVFGRRGPWFASAWLAVALFLPPGLPLLCCLFGPDVLFTLLNALAWFFLARGFRKRGHALAGAALAGLAFLTKYSGLMVMAVFTPVFFSSILAASIQKRSFKGSGGRIATGLMAVSVFLLLCSPLLYHNARFYGGPFYNNNSRYCFWSDSWADYQRFATLSQDRAHKTVHAGALETLRPEQVPSLRNYFKTHTLGFMAYRLWGGIRLNGLVWWKGREPFFALMLIMLLPAFLARGRPAIGELGKTAGDPAVIFSVLYAGVYFMAMAWYSAIAVNLRYVYPLHVLLCAGLFLLLNRIRDRAAAGGRAALVNPVQHVAPE